MKLISVCHPGRTALTCIQKMQSCCQYVSHPFITGTIIIFISTLSGTDIRLFVINFWLNKPERNTKDHHQEVCSVHCSLIELNMISMYGTDTELSYYYLIQF